MSKDALDSMVEPVVSGHQLLIVVLVVEVAVLLAAQLAVLVVEVVEVVVGITIVVVVVVAVVVVLFPDHLLGLPVVDGGGWSGGGDWH